MNIGKMLKEKRDAEDRLRRRDPSKMVIYKETVGGDQSFTTTDDFLQEAVESLNALTGDVTVSGAGGIIVSETGQDIEIDGSAIDPGFPDFMDIIDDGTYEGLAVYDDPPANTSLAVVVGKKDTKNSVYLEGSQADFEPGELTDVEATAAGLELVGETLPTTNLVMSLFSDQGITKDGALVETWADQSGNGNDATAAGAARPEEVADQLNGQPAIRFDGSATGMTLPDLSLTNYTFYAVMKSNIESGNRVVLTNGDPLAFGFFPSGNGWIMVGSTSKAISLYHDYQTGEANIIDSSRSGADNPLMFNNYSQPITSGTNFWSSPGNWIGRRDGGDRYLGDLFAILVYDAVHNDATKKQVRDYLSSYYNIPTEKWEGSNGTTTSASSATTIYNRLKFKADNLTLTAVRHRVRDAGDHTLKIYDNLGAELDSIVVNSASAGDYLTFTLTTPLSLVNDQEYKFEVTRPNSRAYFRSGNVDLTFWQNIKAAWGTSESNNTHDMRMIFGHDIPLEGLPHGNRIALPQDLTSLSTNPGLEIKWDSTEPAGTDVTIETAVKGETSYTDENIGTGDGTEDTFYLPAYPAERHSDVVISVDGTPTAEFTRANADDPSEIIFNAGHEPGLGLAVTTTMTGVTRPSETAEVQTLYLGGATGGTFDLGIVGDMATLAYDASAATIEAALEAIFGTGLVTVAVGTDFTITFSVRVRASALTADFTALTGATAPTLTETTAYSAGDWEEQTTATAITNIPAGDLTGQHLWIRQTLETDDPAETPTLTEVEVYYGSTTYGVFTVGGTVETL